ncbi:hypothetical protein [Pseudoxanthomonas mexicana]|nr:hypothetical protein [Pseudoxanthomonas mexicana]
MKPAYFLDSTLVLQPSRCGIALSANGGDLRDSESARRLAF